MKQADMFLESEGDAFYERNKDKPRLPDPVIEAIQACQLKPKNVLEIGCGNGWRLAELDKIYGNYGWGIDPSEQAVKEAVYKNVYQFDAMTYLPYVKKGCYDLIIFGFCLYLIDREDLMMIAAHTDRVLADKGYIVIHDFWTSPYVDKKYASFKRAYRHKENIWSYHQQYERLWLGNPAYRYATATDKLADDSQVYVLQKDMAAAWPVRET